MPSLTISGVPLLFDFQQQGQAELDRYQRLEDLIVPPENVSRGSWQTNPSAPGRVGLPRYQWPDALRPRISTLYWPTGASRWAYGIFLCNSEQKEAIEAQDCTQPLTLKSTTSTNPPADAVIGTDDEKCTVEAQVWVLNFHRIKGARDANCAAAVDPDGIMPPQDLYLVIVVDDRYFWQFKNLGDIKEIISSTDSCNRDCGTTWETLIEWIASRLGYSEFSADGTIPEAYSTVGPDCQEWMRTYDNAANALDAAAASIGARVVFQFDRTLQLQRPDSADFWLQQNCLVMRQQLAGSICTEIDQRNIPPAVDVVFPKLACYHPVCGEDRYRIRVVNDSDCGPADAVKTFHVSGYADYGCNACNLDGDPDNKDDLQALAEQISRDYLAWIAYDYDFTWSSPRPWVLTGYDDHLLIRFGLETDDHLEAATAITDGQAHTALTQVYRREHQTRVQSWAPNVSVDSLLLGGTMTILGDDILVQICDCWTPDDCCSGQCWPKTTGYLVNWCDCDYKVDSETPIPVYAATGFPGNQALREQLQDLLCNNDENQSCIPIKGGCCDRKWARWDCDTNRWHVVADYDDIWRFELDEDLCRGDCAQAHLRLSCCGGDVIDTEVTFEVCDRAEVICASQFYGVTQSSSEGGCSTDTCGCVPAGTRGIARFWPDKCEWEVLSIEMCDESRNYWVTATSCILPGEIGTAKLTRRASDGTLEDVCEQVVVDNRDCLVIAMPGDHFPVESVPCGTANTWHPSGTYGLQRLVEVTEPQVQCGASTKVKLLAVNCDSQTSGATDCGPYLPEETCEVDACNATGRVLNCGVEGEQVTALLYPGNCCLVLLPTPRPLNATASLGENMCVDDEQVIVSGAKFPGACSWSEEITEARNFYHLQGCDGARVELRWYVEKDPETGKDTCGWDIIQVEHYGLETMVDWEFSVCSGGGDSGEGGGGCSYVKYTKTVAAMLCDCGPPIPMAAGDIPTVDVIVGAGTPSSSSGGGCVMPLKKITICAPTCGAESDTDGFTFQHQMVITNLTFDGLCFVAGVAGIYTPCVDSASTEPVVCGTDCQTDSSSGGTPTQGTCGDTSVDYTPQDGTTQQYNYTVTDGNGNVIGSGGCAGAACLNQQTFPLATPLVAGQTYTITLQYDNGGNPPIVVGTETYTFQCG